MSECLVIVEVSQKQAYIFGSNYLKDNVRRSAIIAYVTSSRFYEDSAPEFYDASKNEVYCGGGHAVLEFSDRDTARNFISKISLAAMKRFPGLELFATIRECQGDEPTAEDVTKLIEHLEEKKAVRRASFKQGSFGVEQVDSSTRDVVLKKIEGENYSEEKTFPFDMEEYKKPFPTGYEYRLAFDALGGAKDESNFIAVVHLDGNAMGKRVEEIRKKYGDKPWSEYRQILKKFSESIDESFKGAFSKMCQIVASNICDGKLGDIELRREKSSGKYSFPIRRVISEGDDICFVTEGRIGIECARIFSEVLTGKVNAVDGKGYSVGAGVAIVHLKYPFYRAYELSEMLCSSSKKFIADSTKGFEGEDAPSAANVSAIDWHIDFGELGDTIEEIRQQYVTADGKQMEMRPYVLDGPDKYMEQEKPRDYRNFRKIVTSFHEHTDEYARGKLKGLRSYIRAGETASWNYIKVNQIDGIVLQCYAGIYEDLDLDRIGSGKKQNRKIFVTTHDGKKRSVLFDAIEVMDTFVELEDEGVDEG